MREGRCTAPRSRCGSSRRRAMRIAAAGISGSTERALTVQFTSPQMRKCRAPTPPEGPSPASRRRQTSDTARASAQIPPATNNANCTARIPLFRGNGIPILNQPQAVAAAPRPAAMQPPTMKVRRQSQGMKIAPATCNLQGRPGLRCWRPRETWMVGAKLIFACVGRSVVKQAPSVQRGSPLLVSAEDCDWNQQIERPNP